MCTPSKPLKPLDSFPDKSNEAYEPLIPLSFVSAAHVYSILVLKDLLYTNKVLFLGKDFVCIIQYQSLYNCMF